MVTLQHMTREQCHDFYREFENDPAVGHYYEFHYDPAWADAYFDRNAAPDRRLFAIMLGSRIIGECKLKDIDDENHTCRMGIHLQNDSVKERGYGTRAERLLLRYAFEQMGMQTVYADAVLGNARSRHVLEKVGFSQTGQDETFAYYRCDGPRKEQGETMEKEICVLAVRQEKDLPVLAELACKLWSGHTVQELQSELEQIARKPDAAFFIAYGQQIPVGFAQCQLRHDYVEGTDSSPVGYLEGIYVAEGCRKQGVARKLLAACESWAKEKGCTQFASDCELDNVQSLQFHLNMGFREANRIICFTKKL